MRRFRYQILLVTALAAIGAAAFLLMPRDKRRDPEVARRYRATDRYVFVRRAGQLRRRARAKGLPYMDGLTDHLEKLWKEQEGRCFYTGRPMALRGSPAPSAMTVDRVRPELGYCRGNIVLCCRIVNCMKQDLNYEEFLALCAELLERRAEIPSFRLTERHRAAIVGPE